jgi:hypothetical protein
LPPKYAALFQPHPRRGNVLRNPCCSRRP